VLREAGVTAIACDVQEVTQSDLVVSENRT
jgi:hypothetical protein